MPPMPERPTYSWFSRQRFAHWMWHSQGLDEFTASTWWWFFFENARPGYWRYAEPESTCPWDIGIELWLVVIMPPKRYRYE